MPYGLHKLTHMAQTLEAQRDWSKLELWCSDHGHSDIATLHKPDETAGWRKIDKSIAAVRRQLGCPNAHHWNGDVLSELTGKEQDD